MSSSVEIIPSDATTMELSKFAPARCVLADVPQLPPLPSRMVLLQELHVQIRDLDNPLPVSPPLGKYGLCIFLRIVHGSRADRARLRRCGLSTAQSGYIEEIPRVLPYPKNPGFFPDVISPRVHFPPPCRLLRRSLSLSPPQHLVRRHCLRRRSAWP